MGTQFSSRLSAGDRNRIVTAMKAAAKKAGIATPLASAVKKASPGKQTRALGNGVVRALLAVAEDHRFSSDFEKSSLFPSVLRWLMALHTDAKFAGFQNIIRRYDLNHASNPVAELRRQLSNLVAEHEEKGADPFRVAVSSAARSIIGEAVIGGATSRGGTGGVEDIGNGFASFDVKRLVSQFTAAFLREFLESLVPDGEPGGLSANDAASLLGAASKRLAGHAIRELETKGVLTDANRVHQAVVAQLRAVLDEAADTVTE